MNEIHDWDAGSDLPLVRELIATDGLSTLLMREFIHGE